MDIVKPSKSIWKHNPRLGLGTKQPDGTVVYSSPDMGRLLEPHIFARFKRIRFELDLPLEEQWDSESDEHDFITFYGIRIYDNFTFDPENLQAFKTFLRQTNILLDFATIMARSPKLTELSINLLVQPMPDHDVIDSDDEEAEEEFTKASDLKATEMFLECGVMDLLRVLSNVSKSTLSVERAVEQGFVPAKDELPAYSRKMIRQLERDIANPDFLTTEEGMEILRQRRKRFRAIKRALKAGRRLKWEEKMAERHAAEVAYRERARRETEERDTVIKGLLVVIIILQIIWDFSRSG